MSLTEQEREAALKEARIQGVRPDAWTAATEMWANGYALGQRAGRKAAMDEICAREGHHLVEVTSPGDLAQGEERSMCTRCTLVVVTKTWTE